MSYWEELDDHLSWLEPTDLNLECVGVSHLDCVIRVESLFYALLILKGIHTRID